MDPETRALLGFIIQLLLSISGQQQLPSDLSTEPVKGGTYQRALLNWIYLDDPTVGLTNAYDQRVDIIGQVGLLQINTAEPHPATLTDILAAFGSIPVYTLPEIPPDGYGNGLSGICYPQQLCSQD